MTTYQGNTLAILKLHHLMTQLTRQSLSISSLSDEMTTVE